MKVVGIIPARLGSSRFPNKPLASICGKTMLEHVYRRSVLCSALHHVVVATPDPEIIAAVQAFGGEAVMTSPDHQRATDRVAEASAVTGGDIVVVIQGDEPLLQPDAIAQVVKPVAEDPRVFCANLTERILSLDDFMSPNTIKVVMNANNDALYFSRSPIPSDGVKAFDRARAYKQVCIIPFTRANLLKFMSLPPTPLEQAESIDMMRVLEHGYTVRMVESAFETHAVDVPDDIPAVERLMARDPIVSRY